jgi:hypothetical protein
MSFMSLPLVASNQYDRNILPTVASEYIEECRLRKEIYWKNKVAYVAPLVTTLIGAIGTEPFLDYKYDEFQRNIQAGFLTVSPVFALCTTYHMPKSVCVKSDDSIDVLRKKSKQCDENIQRGAVLGLVRGVSLPGTIGWGAVGLLYFGDAINSKD